MSSDFGSGLLPIEGNAIVIKDGKSGIGAFFLRDLSARRFEAGILDAGLPLCDTFPLGIFKMLFTGRTELDDFSTAFGANLGTREVATARPKLAREVDKLDRRFMCIKLLSSKFFGLVYAGQAPTEMSLLFAQHGVSMDAQIYLLHPAGAPFVAFGGSREFKPLRAVRSAHECQGEASWKPDERRR